MPKKSNIAKKIGLSWRDNNDSPYIVLSMHAKEYGKNVEFVCLINKEAAKKNAFDRITELRNKKEARGDEEIYKAAVDLLFSAIEKLGYYNSVKAKALVSDCRGPFFMRLYRLGTHRLVRFVMYKQSTSYMEERVKQIKENLALALGVREKEKADHFIKASAWLIAEFSECIVRYAVESEKFYKEIVQNYSSCFYVYNEEGDFVFVDLNVGAEHPTEEYYHRRDSKIASRSEKFADNICGKNFEKEYGKDRPREILLIELDQEDAREEGGSRNNIESPESSNALRVFIPSKSLMEFDEKKTLKVYGKKSLMRNLLGTGYTDGTKSLFVLIQPPLDSIILTDHRSIKDFLDNFTKHEHENEQQLPHESSGLRSQLGVFGTQAVISFCHSALDILFSAGNATTRGVVITAQETRRHSNTPTTVARARAVSFNDRIVGAVGVVSEELAEFGSRASVFVAEGMRGIRRISVDIIERGEQAAAVVRALAVAAGRDLRELGDIFYRDIEIVRELVAARGRNTFSIRIYRFVNQFFLVMRAVRTQTARLLPNWFFILRVSPEQLALASEEQGWQDLPSTSIAAAQSVPAANQEMATERVLYQRDFGVLFRHNESETTYDEVDGPVRHNESETTYDEVDGQVRHNESETTYDEVDGQVSSDESETTYDEVDGPVSSDESEEEHGLFRQKPEKDYFVRLTR